MKALENDGWNISSQPLLGIISTGLVIICAMAFISLFSEVVFSGWVSFLFMCCVPVQIMCGLVWRCEYPTRMAALSQPFKGLGFIALSIAGGAVVASCVLFMANGVTPPGPQHNIFIIMSIVSMFWLVGVFQCQPFASFVKSPLLLGVLLLMAAFTIGGGVFFFAMNFDFMAEAPFYVPGLNGGGVFMAFDLLTFAVTTVAMIMAFILVDFCMVSAMPGASSKPVFIAWTILLIVFCSAGVRGLFVSLLEMDQIVYMAMLPIPFIFGAFIVLNLFENSLAGKVVSLPMKNVINIGLAVTLGLLVYFLFKLLAGAIFGVTGSGAPTYQFDFWNANAMLAISFPFIVVVCDFFQHWPLRVSKSKN